MTVFVFGDIPEPSVQQFLDVLYASKDPLLAGGAPREMADVIRPQPEFMDEYREQLELLNQQYDKAREDEGFVSLEARRIDVKRRHLMASFAHMMYRVGGSVHFLATPGLPLDAMCAKSMLWQAHGGRDRTYEWIYHPLKPATSVLPTTSPLITGVGKERGAYISFLVNLADTPMARKFASADMDPGTRVEQWLANVPAGAA